MTTLSSFLASFTYTSVQEADRRLIWNFAFVSEPHWSFIKLWLLLCLENAFSKAAQKWQSVMINIKQCEHFYLLQRLQREGMLVRSLLAPPLSSHVCLAFCSCSLMWWGGLCGLGHSRPAAWSLSALTTADDCAQRFGHLFQLAGGWGFWLPSWGSRTMLILEIKSSVNETVIASFESISFAVFLILFVFFTWILYLCSGGAQLITLAEFQPLIWEEVGPFECFFVLIVFAQVCVCVLQYIQYALCLQSCLYLVGVVID